VVPIQCPNSPFTPGNAGDYPSLGVSDKHYLLTDHANHPGGSWAFLVTVNAQDAMNGVPQPHIHCFWEWSIGNGENASDVTMPVVNQEKISPIDKGMIVDTEGDTISITTVSNNDPPDLHSYYWNMPDQQPPPDWPQKGSFLSIATGNVGTKPITATEMNGTLVAAFNDCRIWVDSQNDCAPSIHLFSAVIGLLPSVAVSQIDRVIGWRSALDDPANDVVGYGLPGIAINQNHDIAVVYIRTSPLLNPEVRYSTWLHSELDVRPSRLLREGDGPIPHNVGDCICIPAGNCVKDQCVDPHPDTAGVALDPFDHTAIWMAHVHADLAGGFSTAVGKVFGARHPDLIVTKVEVSPKVVHPGDAVQVQFDVHNGGDDYAINNRAQIRLRKIEAANAIVLGETAVASMDAGNTDSNIVYPAKIPLNVPPGNYMVEVEAQIRGGNMDEYSFANNTGMGPVHILQ
jgi:hypothetical protein